MQAKPKLGSVRQLRDFQRLMAGAVMRPLTSSERMQPRWTDGGSTKQAVARFIKPNDRLTSFERLEIYNRQYWFRILDCFYDDYPGLRATLGNRRFERLARAYLVRYPSQSFTLRNLGQHLEKFLCDEPNWTSPHEKVALDMARFEWAQVVAFDGEAKTPVTPDDLLGLKPSEIRLRLQPYITLLQLSYPVDDLILAVKKRDAMRGEASNAVDHRHKETPRKTILRFKLQTIHVAVHRQDNSLYYKRLEPEAFRILTSLARGATLERACLNAFKAEEPSTENWSAKVRGWFQNWASLGWFCHR